MTITLTPQSIGVILRHFEVHREDIIREGLIFTELCGDNYLKWSYFGKDQDKKMHYKSQNNGHRHLCDYFNHTRKNYITAEEKKCDECHAIHGITFTLTIEDSKTETELEYIDFTKDTTLDEMREKLEKISGKTYDFCSCPDGYIVFKDGVCDYCYIHQYTRTEEEGGCCAICYENGGRWVEFDKCKHQFHSVCVAKLEKKICPLCRGGGKILDNPFE